MDERLIRLFEEELRHLRETAVEFAKAFPETAKHLDPQSRPFEGTVSDPYVERLLEGAAFIGARVRLKLDAQFPQFTQGLIETLYPDFLAPVPSMAVFRLEPDPDLPPPPEGLVLGRQTCIQGQSTIGQRAGTREPVPCEFRLAHELRLLPVELTEAAWLVRRLHEAALPENWAARSALRLQFRKLTGAPWSEIRLDPLRLFIPELNGLGYEILEQLLSKQTGLVVHDVTKGGNVPIFVRAGTSVRRFGFDPADALLPATTRTFEGHRLLREYFTLPERFLFVELAGFAESLSRCTGDSIEIIVAMPEPAGRLEREVDHRCFALHCAPGINLFRRQFSQVIEPDRYSDFILVPDANRPLEFEIYSVESVEGFSDSRPQGQVFQPFFRNRFRHRDGSAFFTCSRQPRAQGVPTGDRSVPYRGSEVSIALSDADQAPFAGDLNQLAVTALLTNRHLPIHLRQASARWTLSAGAKCNVRAMVGPTLPSYRPVDGPHAWRLMNLLAVNYLSLVETEGGGAAALRELLSLHASQVGDAVSPRIAALREVACATIARPLADVARDGESARITAIVRGLEISLIFEESAFADLGVLVLGAVLEEFFARYVNLNSFTETVVRSWPDGRVRKRWLARSGLKPLA